jgi:hypothetical protein
MAAQKTTPQQTSRLIPAKRAAAELGLPYSTLRDAHFRGELAVVRIGKGESHQAWYFERADLNQWIKNQKRG